MNLYILFFNAAANAAASSQSFNQGGFSPFGGGGFSGSSANAAAQSQSFNAVSLI